MAATIKITVTGLPQGTVEVKNVEEAYELIRSEDYFRAIGEFMFRFSQLEYTIKLTLASYLKLRDDQFDVVVGPYDFAMLCSVAEKTIQADCDPEVHHQVTAFFNKCRKLNQEARVVVAHGRWSTKGAHHASRQSLAAKLHFETPAKLAEAAEQAVKLQEEFRQMGCLANS